MPSLSMIFALLSILTCVSSAAAAEVRVGLGWEKPPYLWNERGQIRGIEYDILRSVFEKVGYTIKPEAQPKPRLIMNFESHHLDVVTGVREGDVSGAFYSEPYLEFENYAITKKSKDLHLAEIRDLFRFKVVTWDTAYRDLGIEGLYPDEVGKQTAEGNYIGFSSMDRVVRFFWADRADIVLCDGLIFNWYTARMPPNVRTFEPLTYHRLLPAAQSRAAFRDKALRDQFDEALRALRQSGEYDRILSVYGKSDH